MFKTNPQHLRDVVLHFCLQYYIEGISDAEGNTLGNNQRAGISVQSSRVVQRKTYVTLRLGIGCQRADPCAGQREDHKMYSPR
jgi:hypothetical protein